MASSTCSGDMPRLQHLHAVSVEDGAHGSSVDAEPITQLVGCRASRVVIDQCLGLVGVELACPSGFGPVDGRWGWRSEVGGASVGASPGLLTGDLHCSKLPQGPRARATCVRRRREPGRPLSCWGATPNPRMSVFARRAGFEQVLPCPRPPPGSARRFAPSRGRAFCLLGDDSQTPACSDAWRRPNRWSPCVNRLLSGQSAPECRALLVSGQRRGGRR